MSRVCPKCGWDAEEQAHEVDIGVGTLSKAFALDCPNCGTYELCDKCGRPLDRHEGWCALLDDGNFEPFKPYR